jgi:hypothetical protein
MELPGGDGVYAAVVDGRPTGATSLFDPSRLADERLRMLREQVSDGGQLGWVPNSILAGCLADMDDSMPPDSRLPHMFPDGHYAPPFPWQAAFLIGFGELRASRLGDWFFPTIDPRAGQLVLEPGETKLFDTKVKPIFVWIRQPHEPLTKGLPSKPMQDVDGWPTLVVTDRRLVLHGRVQRSGDVDDRVLLGTFLPAIDQFTHLTRETRRAFGRSGLYWASQIRHEWVQAIVVRRTIRGRPKKLLDRLIGGSGGESNEFAIEVELPSGKRAEIYFDKGKQGMVRSDNNFIDAGRLVDIVADAISRCPASLRVSDNWEEHAREIKDGIEAHRYLRVDGAVPVSFVAGG